VSDPLCVCVSSRQRPPAGAEQVGRRRTDVDTDHFRNWIAAVRSRKTSDLAADVAEGHLSSSLCHLANIAQRTRRTVVFDPKTERFPGDDEANRLLSREYRAPYVVPEQV
jgi:hypothetical protein